MAPKIEPDDLLTSWRALAGGAGEGWRTISLGQIGALRISAGRRHPGNLEAVLCTASGWSLPPGEPLPSGKGFDTLDVALPASDESQLSLALVRQQGGSLELFTMMVIDVLGVLERTSGEKPGSAMRALLARVRAWQEFMHRGHEGILGRETELGLVGELKVIAGMLEAGVSGELVIDAWKGPLDEEQDFAMPMGAIEVKASVATAGFLATIGSLEQLDDSHCAPLFLAGVRLNSNDQGQTLPELVASIRQALLPGSPSSATFDDRLVRAGYLDAQSSKYFRRFQLRELRMLRVDHAFPRLIHAGVPTAVRRARYELDLDLIQASPVTLAEVLTITGAL